ncbi:hypothetical protein SEA_YABOI_123 [Streptomyces phage Yaboi]|uniref:Uncharacterized protein n=3 Tax=Streptomyces virus Yaboi TaxID=2846408 RepID=A0A385UH41_9CAUD|nr:hypothetical protein HWB86_gp168 [Streptomyces phage Yaboi]AYB70951.1 hypothetical protein SEA_YABOI_123 [Streptomyces phage Yaboi]QAY08775.1 hypothetical protein SEA_GENIE2_123 [Streptomyces phage Genie2]QAY12765.1 hypothetical protein SEA_BOOMERJR_123 [Streptomyces phage BoomerJR]WNM73701.1 hypothetical protein SEA_SOLLERTIA_122 [Streptomyces phage Sollertia]
MTVTLLSRRLSRCHTLRNVTVSLCHICHFLICHAPGGGRRRGSAFVVLYILRRSKGRGDLTEQERPVKVNYTGKRKEKE